MLRIRPVLLALLVAAYVRRSGANTPANCTYEEIVGVWRFSESSQTADRMEVCDNGTIFVNNVTVELQYPNIAVDEFGHKGTWTMVYNQGFEVTVADRKYYAFSDYKIVSYVVTSLCDRTKPGWSHDIEGKKWACYQGTRVKGPFVGANRTHTIADSLALDHDVFRQDPAIINEINAVQNSWTAKHYPQFEGIPLTDMHRLHGGPASTIYSYPTPADVTQEVRRVADTLPEQFDWRNVSGVNYVTSVKYQGYCGSCYAYGSIGMIEARIKVLTNNTLTLDLSEQDVVQCSHYSQACEGGFPYLIAGKYGQDYGFTTDDPYLECTPDTKRYYTARYGYVGGYYGGCNEPLMRAALVRDGPLTVSVKMALSDDFVSYGSGIYGPTGVRHRRPNGEYNPWIEVNHSVLIVGYGSDAQTNKTYWIVKNSWGDWWGDKGYFKVDRGVNAMGIESIAVEAIPVPIPK
ncbi:unnamed protein product [Oppiella nova]|uniref:Dipeptidyl peptidase 1 n=1 Tax=Oppiella nova TaxID=334625 RepID=A0A7R9MCK7_9ACAR|nr:unnamed protein product [Oppiella nova]CAG2174750.1 unnamed protein product [Oppiella nova]